MANHAKPTSLVLVTGHSFGIRAFEGIFSAPACLDGRLNVALTIGLDDARAAGTVGYQSLGALAAQQGVPYVSTSDGRLLSLADRIRAAEPAYLLVIGWSRLIPDEVLAIPAEVAGAAAGGAAEAAGVAAGRSPRAGAHGCIGMHPTKLPHGRGQAPIPWTIIKGGAVTALSVFFLEAAADTGPVIAQYDLPVHPRETGASLFYRIGHTHFTAGYELAEALGNRQVLSRVQDEAAASRWPKRRPADGEILPTMTCREVDALVRALLGPYPRAFAMVEGEQVFVRSTEAGSAGANGGGTAGIGTAGAGADGRFRFRCRDGVLNLIRDEAAGT
jgi:methionyl-tRNA formyltransferase